MFKNSEDILPKKNINNGSFCIWNTDNDNAYTAAHNVLLTHFSLTGPTGSIGQTVYPIYP